MNRILNLLLLSSLIVLSCDFTSEKNDLSTRDLKEPVSTTEEKDVDVFGIDKSLESTTHVIRRNESLSTILGNNGLSSRKIHELTRATQDLFDVRRLRAGRPLNLYLKPDSTGTLKKLAFVVYEENHTDFVRFHLTDSVYVTRDSKPVEIKTRIVNGYIKGSVYQTMLDLDVKPELTHRLADVFAWQIDFYRIRKGDHFKVLFEEKWVDGKVSEIGRIKAAFFQHHENDYYAFHYNQDELDEHFDEEGNSLRRQFMAAPLDYSRITSRFTNRRFHPILQRHIPHHGIDYAAPVGTPIRAVGDGKITVARYNRNNGNYVRIRHNSIYETGYLHMSRFAEGIKPGVKVKQGQVIGFVGSTGLATGPHVCFRFWKHGQPVNPQRIDLPPADPIQEEHRLDFFARKRELLTHLDIDPDTVGRRPVLFALDFGYNGKLSKHNQEQKTQNL